MSADHWDELGNLMNPLFIERLVERASTRNHKSLRQHYFPISINVAFRLIAKLFSISFKKEC